MLKRRITIIDRDAEFCGTLSSIIRNSGRFQVSRVYHDTRDALRKILDDFPEIVIMDLDFAELKGIDFILKAREKMPGLDILVLTNYEDEQIVFHTLAHGASGYLLKKNCFSEIINSLKVIAEGGSPLDPQVARYVVRSMQISLVSPLSSRETTVLKLLTQGKTYTHISSDLLISSETVKTHIKNIYRKLNVNSKAQAVKKAVEEQLIVGHMAFNFTSVN